MTTIPESTKGLTMGDFLDRQITYHLPLKLVHSLQNKFNGDFFVETDYCYAVRSRFHDPYVTGARAVHGKTPILNHDSNSLDDSFNEIFQLLGVDYSVRTSEPSKRRSKRQHQISRAYCGWMIQQEEYHSDIESLKSRFRDQLIWYGVNRPNEGPSDIEIAKHGDHRPLYGAVDDICSKWRLDRFETIELPAPLEPAFIGANSLPTNFPTGMIGLTIPDIFPIEGRGDIVEMLESRRDEADSPHLKDWYDLVRSTARNKKRWDTLARQYHVQHFWRILSHNHSESICRRKTAIIEVFSEHFGISFDVMKSDFRQLEKLSFSLFEIPLEILY